MSGSDILQISVTIFLISYFIYTVFTLIGVNLYFMMHRSNVISVMFVMKYIVTIYGNGDKPPTKYNNVREHQDGMSV